MKDLKDIKINDKIGQCCNDCGMVANYLTCFKKYGTPPTHIKITTSTYHNGICDFCHEKKAVTEARDFFYPDFALLERIVKKWRKN